MLKTNEQKIRCQNNIKNKKDKLTFNQKRELLWEEERKRERAILERRYEGTIDREI